MTSDDDAPQESRKARMQRRAKLGLVKSLKRTKKQFTSLWFFHYNWRSCLIDDIIAALTIAIMQIPQGMAYAMLANLPAEMGIYCSVFPVLVYGIIGPSPHISMGTCGPLCLIVASVIGRHLSLAPTESLSLNDTAASTALGGNSVLGTPLANSLNNPLTEPPALQMPAIGDASEDDVAAMTSMATLLCLMTGLWQIVLAGVQLGKFSWILSDVVMSSYTLGAAIHVFTSQLRPLLGLKFPRISKPYLKLAYTYVEFFKHISDTNPAALFVSTSTMLALILHDFAIKPAMAKKCRFPVPIQLIVVVIGTALSFGFDLANKYNVDVVGSIPSGFPSPSMPTLITDGHVVASVIVDSLILAIVGYSISLSMAQLYAHKFHYPLGGNFQLLTEGVANVAGSFFFCFPAAGSMARSSVLVSVGGKTQLAGLLSGLILVIVLLFIGPVFETLPKAVLSGIIVVALRGMFLQTQDFRKFFKKSKLDGFLWLGTFIGVVLTNVDIGLVIAVALTVLVMAYRSYEMKVVVGHQYETLPLLESDSFSRNLCDASSSGSGIGSPSSTTVILSLTGVLTFANVEATLKKCTHVMRSKKEAASNQNILARGIFEMSCVPYVDQIAANSIKEWMEGQIDEELTASQIDIIAPSEEVRKMLGAVGVSEIRIFSSFSELGKRTAVTNDEDSEAKDEDLFVTIM